MILTLIQARVSSSRLPGKALKTIMGRPLLALQIERMKRMRKSDQLAVATSLEKDDAAIENLCTELHVGCFRGDLNDVLDRYYQAARNFNADVIMRVTGDCPLIDPAILDQTIDYFMKGKFDYVSNALEPTFPDGLDAEIFRFSSLEQAWKEAKLPSEREHVSPFIYKHPERFKLGSYKGDRDLSKMRWTVDHADDFEFVKKVYEALYPANPAFGMQDILNLLEKKPQLSQLNDTHARNEGYARSLRKDVKPDRSKGKR